MSMISDATSAEITRLLDLAIHECVFVSENAENDNLEDALDVLDTALRNIEQVKCLLEAVEASATGDVLPTTYCNPDPADVPTKQ